MTLKLRFDNANSEWTRVASLGIAMHARVWDRAAKPSSVPLVFVAGLGASSRYWIPLGKRLSKRFHIIAPDMPGFGKSKKPRDARWPAGPGPREQADQLLAWLDARGISQAILCGHSTGCQTVVDFAARFPDRVRKIILLCPTFEIGRRTLRSQLPRLLAGSVFEKPSMLFVIHREYSSAGAARMLQQATRMMRDAIDQKAPHVLAPTLVVCAKFDPLVPVRWARFLASQFANATLVEIDRVGHAVQYSAPTVTADVIDEFLHDRIGMSRLVGSMIAPVDEPQFDPHGWAQPISANTHGAIDYILSAAAFFLPRVLQCGVRTRGVLNTAATINIASNLLSDHRYSAARKQPMVAHVNGDIACGLGLLIASAGYLRREPRAARCAVALLGVYQIIAAALTAKPTGPARLRYIGKAKL